MEETQTTHSGWAQKKTRQTAGLLICFNLDCGSLLGFHSQFLERLGGVSAVLAGPHFLVNLQDFAVLADVERPPERHGPRVRHHAVGAGGLLGGIAQDWVIQLQRLGKTDVALDADGRITTSSEVGDVKFPQLLAVRTERLALSCSATGERLGIPSDHHGLFASEFRELVCFAVTALQCEIRSRIADLQVCRVQDSTGKTRHENQDFFHLSGSPHHAPFCMAHRKTVAFDCKALLCRGRASRSRFIIAICVRVVEAIRTVGKPQTSSSP